MTPTAKRAASTQRVCPVGSSLLARYQTLAFISYESGRPEVYVQAFEPLPTPTSHSSANAVKISRDGAWLVRWRPDGREIFYLGLDNWLHAVPVEAPLQFGQSARSPDPGHIAIRHLQ
jgi:D-hexose-6-phosphate mutarotase